MATIASASAPYNWQDAFEWLQQTAVLFKRIRLCKQDISNFNNIPLLKAESATHITQK